MRKNIYPTTQLETSTRESICIRDPQGPCELGIKKKYPLISTPGRILNNKSEEAITSIRSLFRNKNDFAQKHSSTTLEDIYSLDIRKMFENTNTSKQNYYQLVCNAKVINHIENIKCTCGNCLERKNLNPAKTQSSTYFLNEAFEQLIGISDLFRESGNNIPGEIEQTRPAQGASRDCQSTPDTPSTNNPDPDILHGSKHFYD